MVAKKRLGRGLENLISDGFINQESATVGDQSSIQNISGKLTKKNNGTFGKNKVNLPSRGFFEILVNDIVPSPYQARKEFPENELLRLTESIKAEGLIHPIVVRLINKKYELIAGERRWRAFKHLKVKRIPAHILETTDVSAASLSLVENLQRRDLNAIEEAYGYASLIEEFSLTQEKIAQRLGKGRTSITNSLRLLQLDPKIQAFVRKNLLSPGHAKVILGIGDPDLRLIASRRIIEKNLSVREAEIFIKTLIQKNTNLTSSELSDNTNQKAFLEDIERQISDYLKTKVQIAHAPKKGKIIVEYYGDEDLHRVMEKLTVNYSVPIKYD